MSLSKKDAPQLLKQTLNYTTLQSGTKTVGTSAVQIVAVATPVALGAMVKAPSTNTGKLYLGFDNTVSSSTGYELAASESVFISIDDLSKIWVIASAASQAACYIGS